MRVWMPAVGGIVAAVSCPAVIRDGVEVVARLGHTVRSIVSHLQTFQRKIDRDRQFASVPFRRRESLQICVNR